MIIVFDIDGTVADISHRLHYLYSKGDCEPGKFKKDWKSFDAAAINDKPIGPIRNIFRTLCVDHFNVIIFATGRNERNRTNTTKWLLENGMGLYDQLLMRKEDDYRSDVVVKKEMLDEITKKHGRPDIVFEDRPRVVQMWRDNGIYCVDVYQGVDDF